MSDLDPELAAVVDDIQSAGVPAWHRLSVERARRVEDDVFADDDPREVAFVRNLAFDGPRGAVPVRVYHDDPPRPAPVVVFYHGGGWTLGTLDSIDGPCRELATRADAVVVSVDYRLAPEHPHPAAIDDCVAAYRDLTGRVDPSMTVIAGDSAGGGATLATLTTLRDSGDPLPACAYLLSPWTDLTMSGDTIVSKADVDPMIPTDLISSAAEMYAGDQPLDDPRVSPLFADLSGLPPVLIQTGVDEVLLADSTRLADRLTAAGVYNELDLAEGMWHVYPMFTGVMPEAGAALAHAARFIRARTRVDH